MKKSVLPLLLLIFLRGLALKAHATTNNLTAELALPLACAGERGFRVRTVQASESLANSYRRAVEQVNGTLTGLWGTPVMNVANAGTNSDGSFDLNTINFESNATEIFIWDTVMGFKKVFNPGLFPGVAVEYGYFQYFTVEIITFLELPKGRHIMGLCVSAARTDVADDDDYQLSVGLNPQDFFSQPIARFERTVWIDQPYTPVENLVTVDIPVTGLYPFRLLYWQTSWGANLQWYTLNPDTHERILINDPADGRALRAYRSVIQPRAMGPYVGEVNP